MQGRITHDHIIRFRYSAFHYPVVVFVDDAGISHEVKIRYHRKPHAREQLNNVEIAYLRENPEDTAILVGFRYYLPTAFTALYFLTLTSLFPALLFWIPQ